MQYQFSIMNISKLILEILYIPGLGGSLYTDGFNKLLKYLIILLFILSRGTGIPTVSSQLITLLG